MLRLQIIAFFLSIVLAIQVIPASQLGNLVGVDHVTENLAQTTGDDTDLTTVDFSNATYLPANVYAVTSILTARKATIYIDASQHLPRFHSPDVVTPPPDLFS